MTTLAIKITLYAPQCHSLKEKRMILQRIIARVKNKFNVSVAEVDLQDFHQTIVLGVAVVSCSQTQAKNVLDEVLRFIESIADADITNVDFA
jgi:uncharacterized protein YlxP (DUF503 family)